MTTIQLIPGQHIHMVGIGGFGLSAIARVLLMQGFYITGSDRSENDLTRALERDGARIYHQHEAKNVNGAEMLVVSSAVPPDHVEVLAAEARGLPIYKRQDIIGSVMSGHVNIAIAGTHGKTTTTAMVAHTLVETGQRPSYIIGGLLRTTNTNASIDTGRTFVIEADEYDNMFHGLDPHIEVITSVEWDHPDFFSTPNELTRSFSRFIGQLPDEGLLVTCADDPIALIFAENRLVVGLPVVTYGLSNPLATWRAANLRTDDAHNSVFDVLYRGKMLGTVTLQLPGRHNVLNALAAVAVAHSQGVPFADTSRTLSTFTGTGRRFEVRGEIDGVTVVDDYAHHPTAIRVTLEAARERYDGQQIWAVWQPHTYSRVQSLMEEYVTSFDAADHVLVTDIYAARERPIPYVTGSGVVAAIDHPHVQHTPNIEDVLEVLNRELVAPAVVLVLSAGDGPVISGELLKRRESRKRQPGEYRVSDTPDDSA